MKRLNNSPILKQRRVELRKNQTKQESVLWQKLRKHNLKFKFKRQHSFGPYILVGITDIKFVPYCLLKDWQSFMPAIFAIA